MTQPDGRHQTHDPDVLKDRQVLQAHEFLHRIHALEYLLEEARQVALDWKLAWIREWTKQRRDEDPAVVIMPFPWSASKKVSKRHG